MKKHKNAKKYAKMFLNAVAIDEAPRALKELAAVSELVGGSSEFKSLLTNPLFGRQERVQAVEAVGGAAGLSGGTVRFVNFLSDEGAAWAVGDVLEKANAIYSERMSRVKATVMTPSAIDAQYEGRLRESLKRITNRDVEIEYSVDPSLIGGLLVKVGSTMFDSSISGQLRLLKQELIKG